LSFGAPPPPRLLVLGSLHRVVILLVLDEMVEVTASSLSDGEEAPAPDTEVVLHTLVF